MIKKIFAILNIFFVLSILTACTNLNENLRFDALRIAKEQFGMDKIFVVSLGTMDSFLVNQSKHRRSGFRYVLGEKDGTEIMIIVPQLKKDPAYEVDFPFAFSFKECIDKLNSSEKGIICETEEDYSWIHFYDAPDFFKSCFHNLSAEDVDIVFFIEFSGYCIVQINNECVIYGEGFTQ